MSGCFRCSRYISGICCWILFSAVISQAKIDSSHNKTTISAIFKNYSPLLKPRHSPNDHVNINITLHFHALHGIDERLQTMTSYCWFEIRWVDEFLILDNNTKSILVHMDNIWYPDVSLYNSVEDPQHMNNGKFVILFQNGHVTWYPGRKYTVSCEIDIKKYPFDKQHCSMVIGSWHRPATTQRLVDSGKGVVVFRGHENGEWEVTSTSTEHRNDSFDTPISTSIVTYHIYLQRRPMYHLLNTVFPIILLSFLNSLVFLLPAKSGEKITLCISVFVAFIVYLTIFNNTMPKTSIKFSVLSVYLCEQILMSATATILTIITKKIIHNQQIKQRDTCSSSETYDSGDEMTSSHACVGVDNRVTGSEDVDTKESSKTISQDVERESSEQQISQSHTRNRFSSTFRELSASYHKQAKNIGGKSGQDVTNIDQVDFICFWLTFGVTTLSTVVLFLIMLL